jgi:spore coat protein U-like protein
LKSINGDEIEYAIAIVNDNSGTPSTSATTSLSSFGQNVTGFDPETGLKSMDLYISYDVGGMPKQGTYTDTITITIMDN